MKELPPDVCERITRDFGDHAEAIKSLLVDHVGMDSECALLNRVARCIIQAADGNVQTVSRLLDLAQQDARDVIVAGEYNHVRRQIRDLRVSFLIDGPEKFWAGEVAVLMARRGYQLIAIESHKATKGPFEYPADSHEGQATFVGKIGEVIVEKKLRKWKLMGNPRDLVAHSMDRAFDEESVFRDAVSGYLLSEIRITDQRRNHNAS